MLLRWLAGFLLLAGCGGPSYGAGDIFANTYAARVEARQAEACSADVDGGAPLCTPAFIRASSSLAFCASARELASHGAPVPDSGIACPAGSKP